MSMVDSTPIAHFKLFLGSDEVTDARTTLGFITILIQGATQLSGRFQLEVMRTRHRDGVSSGRRAKVIKPQAREYGSSNEGKLHNVAYWDGSASAQFLRPLLGIKAIG